MPTRAHGPAARQTADPWTTRSRPTWRGCALLRALVARTEDITDAEARAPSRLPGWSVGHVLTHIARNGDSVARRLEGVARGEIVDQYPGGYEGRAADIERGAHRPAPELVADLLATHERIDAAVGLLGGDAWDGLSRDVGGDLDTGPRSHRRPLARGRGAPRRPGQGVRARPVAGGVRPAPAAPGARRRRPAAARPRPGRAGCGAGVDVRAGRAAEGLPELLPF